MCNFIFIFYVFILNSDYKLLLNNYQEEVMNLRKTARRASTMARKNEKFSSKTAKLKWTGIEKNITKVS